MDKLKRTKAIESVDFEILYTGICDAIICTRLPIKEATARLNLESPTGIRSRWTFNSKKSEKMPCPDGQGKTHYRLFC